MDGSNEAKLDAFDMGNSDSLGSVIVCGKRYEATIFLFGVVPSDKRRACSATKPLPYDNSVKYSLFVFAFAFAIAEAVAVEVIAPKFCGGPCIGPLLPTVFVRICVVLAFCVCSNSSTTRRFR